MCAGPKFCISQIYDIVVKIETPLLHNNILQVSQKRRRIRTGKWAAVCNSERAHILNVNPFAYVSLCFLVINNCKYLFLSKLFSFAILTAHVDWLKTKRGALTSPRNSGRCRISTEDTFFQFSECMTTSSRGVLGAWKYLSRKAIVNQRIGRCNLDTVAVLFSFSILVWRDLNEIRAFRDCLVHCQLLRGRSSDFAFNIMIFEGKDDLQRMSWEVMFSQ